MPVFDGSMGGPESTDQNVKLNQPEVMHMLRVLCPICCTSSESMTIRMNLNDVSLRSGVPNNALDR